MTQQEHAKSLSFVKEDFLTQDELTHFVRHLSQIEDVDTYMKRAIINRVMMDTQASDDTSYMQLMKHVQDKGIEQVLACLSEEKASVSATPSLNETDVERIVLRLLAKHYPSVPYEKEETVSLHSAKTQNTPLEERKKPSMKLKNL